MDDRTPHPKNAPGPFYIVDGCCTACMVIHSEAAAMMGFDEADNHCFVYKQPETAEELYHAIEAVRVAELGCLRYGGDDPEIIRRLVELGEGAACDHPELSDAVPVLRNHVTFEAVGCGSPLDAATMLREYLASLDRLSVASAEDRGGTASLALAWYRGDFHTVWFGEGEPGQARWLAYHSPVEQAWSRSLSSLLAEWLRSDSGFSAVRWYTAADWKGGRERWQETPY